MLQSSCCTQMYVLLQSINKVLYIYMYSHSQNTLHGCEKAVQSLVCSCYTNLVWFSDCNQSSNNQAQQATGPVTTSTITSASSLRDGGPKASKLDPTRKPNSPGESPDLLDQLLQGIQHTSVRQQADPRLYRIAEDLAVEPVLPKTANKHSCSRDLTSKS